MYQALYRKWRPLVFADVIGQPHITTTLQRQVESGRLSHAYLFTGSRGTGKTTCAKILARASCCEKPRKGDPCNACAACKGILDGSILDVVEIDAASNSGVENIRALREETAYAPVAVAKRVYIIDEVHMLSQGAFNALLKTLEEPPPHVLFILATTETHKVPATIVSRCQRFAFHRISAAGIEARLEMVAKQEHIAVTPEALGILSRMADGALRDGLSLLDQCAALAGDGTIDETLCREALGLSGRIQTAEWLLEIGRQDSAAALRRLETLYQSGRDFSALLDELSTLMRDLMFYEMLEDPAALRLPDETAAAALEMWPRERLLWGISLLQETQNRLGRSVNKRIESELCLMKLAGENHPVAPKPVAPPPKKPPKPTPPPVGPIPSKPEALEPPPGSQGGPPPLDKGGSAEGEVVAPDAQWAVLLTKVNPLYKNALDNAGHTALGGTLHITAEPYALGLLGQDDFRQAVEALYPGGLVLEGPGGRQTDNRQPAEDRMAQLQRDAGDSIKIERN